MVEIPTVKSFCGCVDLKVACIAIASFRMIAYIIAIVVYLFLFFILGYAIVEIESEDRSKDDEGREVLQWVEFFMLLWFLIAFPIACMNVLFSYWFILGATKNNPTRMKYYVIIIPIDIVLLLIRFNLAHFMIAAVECYIFICSYSLYKECTNFPQENALNTTENTVIRYDNVPAPPPLYNSCENETKSQNYPQENP